MKKTRIIMEFEDGSKKFIVGKDLQNYNDNQITAGMLCHTHGIVFKPIKWKKPK